MCLYSPAMSRSPESRACGCLLGLAAGSALARRTAGAAHAADVALALIQAEELLQPEFDLQRMAHRWVDWSRRDGFGLDGSTRRALDHIAEFDGPPETLEGEPLASCIARTIPVALATASQPENLASGSFHIAYLLDPDPRAGWSSVAVNAAIACYLQGITDFVPEVLEVLKQNDAPGEVLEAVRRVPREKREALPLTGPRSGLAVSAVEIALWFAYNEPRFQRGLESLAAEAESATVVAITTAVLGARDGEGVIPGQWQAMLPDAGRIHALALRLVGALSPLGGES